MKMRIAPKARGLLLKCGAHRQAAVEARIVMPSRNVARVSAALPALRSRPWPARQAVILRARPRPEITYRNVSTCRPARRAAPRVNRVKKTLGVTGIYGGRRALGRGGGGRDSVVTREKMSAWPKPP